ncbi:S-adenosylmethionine-dependent methyltransferase [Sphaerisporangium rufum]|uniref:S-adenosylmethionine-dependent methyltransferase n=1 Tax=Sphaerisporangium rufum TaxID=1381558 RepID=A0A919V2S0_9ACTN|nr:class I SAM-dependent methyltransferase [Sphaerisporangium rufum]GII81014.1 S-adenosylmethionine-dependent methyltransferase [Sphaerisporangium rufum]
MIGRRELPQEQQEWNQRWGVPYGRDCKDLSIAQRIDDPDPSRFGPFAYQRNNHTRLFEYPWAYFTAAVEPGMRVVDVGGGLGGLQFVLASEGCEVVNVDPEARQVQDWADKRGWTGFPSVGVPLTEQNHKRLNDAFKTDVRLVTDKIQDVDLPKGTFDRAFCLSVIEHVGQEEARDMLRAMHSLLRPGGLVLLTIDLFLDCKPFGVLDHNVWGTNVDVYEMVSGLGFEVAAGDPRELLGFPEWDYERVVSHIPDYLMGYFSALSQAIALRKPA